MQKAKRKSPARLATEHRLTIISIIASAAVGILSLIISIWGIRRSERPLASRVEISQLAAGVNGKASLHDPWVMYWTKYRGDGYEVGLKKRIVFTTPFGGTPKCQAYLKFFGVRSGRQIAGELGIKLPPNFRPMNDIDMPNTFAWTSNPDRFSCTVSVGIVIPGSIAVPLIKQLKDYDPTGKMLEEDEDFLDDQNSRRAKPLNQEEKRMLAFLRYVGHINVSYIAAEDVK
jgi:hypothetical protein